ncbi:hypothetical protein RhiirA5_428141 [Rhizophagus irregularis]|uniref:HCP-like protein n=1 Tax=Rhizophagus irregularis TaxID=588596 RepID=A0A2N0P0Z3_9GLOM|nr:hypothetical protein RhiirA5_428141 [Rhizophagus irregularis]
MYNNKEIRANNGNVDAMYELGLCHNDGEGVEKDYNKAFKLFKQSTGRGFPGGMMMLLMLGYCYDEGFTTNSRQP